MNSSFSCLWTYAGSNPFPGSPLFNSLLTIWWLTAVLSFAIHREEAQRCFLLRPVPFIAINALSVCPSIHICAVSFFTLVAAFCNLHLDEISCVCASVFLCEIVISFSGWSHFFLLLFVVIDPQFGGKGVLQKPVAAPNRAAAKVKAKATREKACPPWAQEHGITRTEWSAADKRMHASWRRAWKASKQSKQRTRSRSIPPWALESGITDHEWCKATAKQLNKWKYRHRTSQAEPESGEDEDDAEDLRTPIAVEERIFGREYSIKDLDLTWARQAQRLHVWEDQYCVDMLMSALEAGQGTLTFLTYFAHALNRGRLYLAWPTLLHVNKTFRAVLLYPQADCYSDLDMSNAHSNICQYLAVSCGLLVPALLAYIRDRHTLRKVLTEQGVNDEDSKRLWLSLLNSGSLKGWLFRLRQKAPHLAIKIPEHFKDHCAALQDQVGAVRSCILQKDPWCVFLTAMVARNAHSKKKKSKEQLRSGAWNCVLCTLETEIIAMLQVHIEEHSAARVVMPSYDGLLLQHAAKQFKWDDALQRQWRDVCMNKWGFEFPVEIKKYLEHMPKWLSEIIRLRSLA